MAKKQNTSTTVVSSTKQSKVPTKTTKTDAAVKVPTAGKATKATPSEKVSVKGKAPAPAPAVTETTTAPTTTTRKRKVAADFIDETPVKKVAGVKKVGIEKKKKDVEKVDKVGKKKVEVEEPVQSSITPSTSVKSTLKPTSLKSALKPSASSTPKAIETEDTFIHGFTSEEDEGGADSSDEDDSDFEGDDAAIEAEKMGGKSLKNHKIDVSKLPTIAKDDKSVQRKLEKARRKQDTERGVIYLGRIPHGFYEDEMKSYFEQFGEVTRLRLARNRKTGASKHFAYIEMASKSVAEITADTMDNYLLLGHILKCAIVPIEKLHPDLWIGANKKWRRVPTARIERMTHDKQRTAEEIAQANARAIKKDQKRQTKMKSLGIDYEYEGFSKEAAEVSMVL